MSAFMVWVESDMAKVFDLEVEAKEPKILRHHMVMHHSGRADDKPKNNDKFFQKIAEKLKDAKEVLLVGPGLAKKGFFSYLESHYPAIAKAVVGLENADNHQSDNQLLAMSRKFFRYFDAYGQVPADAESPRR